MTQLPNPQPEAANTLPDMPLTVERQLARQLGATHRATMLLHQQLERFAAEMLGTADGIQRGSLIGLTQLMVGITARIQGLHHDGARTLVQVRNDGQRRVDVHHTVERHG